jgi:hypothetical protein
MQVGDHVDIIANGTVLAADALVLSLMQNTTSAVIGEIVGVIVAVPAELSAAVASAAAIGDATLVVSS